MNYVPLPAYITRLNLKEADAARDEIEAIQSLRLVCGGYNDRFEERMSRARERFRLNFERVEYLSLAECIRFEVSAESRGHKK